MMDTLMSETCLAHKKWNRIESDIKLVFHSSTITMMHGPITLDYEIRRYEEPVSKLKYLCGLLNEAVNCSSYIAAVMTLNKYENWWNDIGKETPRFSEKNLS